MQMSCYFRKDRDGFQVIASKTQKGAYLFCKAETLTPREKGDIGFLAFAQYQHKLQASEGSLTTADEAHATAVLHSQTVFRKMTVLHGSGF